MKAIIVGGGKVGFYLTKTLLERGYNATIIENDKEQSHFCANNIGAEVVCGDGTSVETLAACGADKADCVIAVTGKDECNLICCQVAKKAFGVRKTIAKVNNPKNAEVMKQLGIDITVSSTQNIIQMLEHEVDFGAIKRLLTMDNEFDDATLVEIMLPENYVYSGKKLSELSIPEQCNIACINRGGKTIIPRGATVLMGGDIVMVVMMNSREKELRRALKIKD